MNSESERGEGEAPAPGENENQPDTTPTASQERQRMWVQSGRIGYIGIFFGIAVGIGFLTGRWLDDRFDTRPWFTLFFVLCGIAAGMKELFGIAKQLQREDRENE